MACREAGEVAHLGGSLSLHGELEGHGGAHGLPQHVQLCSLNILLVARLAWHERVVGELGVHASIHPGPRKEVRLSKLAFCLNACILLSFHPDPHSYSLLRSVIKLCK